MSSRKKKEQEKGCDDHHLEHGRCKTISFRSSRFPIYLNEKSFFLCPLACVFSASALIGYKG